LAVPTAWEGKTGVTKVVIPTGKRKENVWKKKPDDKQGKDLFQNEDNDFLHCGKDLRSNAYWSKIYVTEELL
jgi:hypothetical protein